MSRIKELVLDKLQAFVVELVRDELDDIRSEVSEVANGAVTDVSLRMDLDSRDEKLRKLIADAATSRRPDPTTYDGAYLSGADLQGKNLSGSNLYKADLSNANLSNANLFGADLSYADLRGADLTGAELSNTDLSSARWDDRPPPDGWEVVWGQLQRA